MTVDILSLAQFAQDSYPDKLRWIPLQVVHLARQGKVRNDGTRRGARLTLEVPDDMIKNIKGDKDQMNVYSLLVIDREVTERFESPILAPGEKR